MHSLKLTAALSLLLGLAPMASANDAYVRYADGDSPQNAALQTAVAHFTHPESKVEIVLYGVVHIGDADYYARVQKDLDSYDVVMFEGVAPGTKKPDNSAKGLGEMQQMMGDMLGLSFQKDGIDYTRSNLVHADMNMDQLSEAMGGKSFNPLGGLMDEKQMKSMAPMMKMIGGFAKTFMQGNPAMQDRFKTMMAKQMTGGAMNQMPAEFQRVILIERNKVVMEILEEQLKKTTEGTIGIFYGAAHNPDFEERLNKLGWQRTHKRWMSAWKIGQGVGADEAPLPRSPKVPTVSTGKRITPNFGRPTAPAEEAPAPEKKTDEPRWF